MIKCPNCQHTDCVCEQKEKEQLSPSHYRDGKIEVWDFIEDKKLNFNKGNAIKYISRAGKKNKDKEVEDLKKAIVYLNREISLLEWKIPM